MKWPEYLVKDKNRKSCVAVHVQVSFLTGQNRSAVIFIVGVCTLCSMIEVHIIKSFEFF